MDKEEVLEESAEIETELEAEVEEVKEAESEEVVAEDSDDDDTDYGFEYDEDGNVIIPDIEPDIEEDEEESEESEEDSKSDDTQEEDKKDTSSDTTEAAPPSTKGKGEKKPDERDDVIKRLRGELDKYEKQTRDTLKKLGKEKSSNLDGLAEIAAEAEGLSLKEYQDKRTKEDAKEEARRVIRLQMYEIQAANDLKALHAEYPETRQYKHISELPDEVRKKFGNNRDLGLTVKEAYAAANPDGIRAEVAASVKKQEQHASKSHLTSIVPKASKDTSVTMSKKELASFRNLFPEKSDAELIKLYKQSKPNY